MVRLGDDLQMLPIFFLALSRRRITLAMWKLYPRDLQFSEKDFKPEIHNTFSFVSDGEKMPPKQIHSYTGVSTLSTLLLMYT